MSEPEVDERRVEELLRERARRSAREPMGPDASARLLEGLRRERAAGRFGWPRWLAAGLAAAAVVLALWWIFGSGPDFGELPLEIALLDAQGRPLESDPAVRGPGDAFVRPGEVLIEMVPRAPGGSWWVWVYDPRGRLHAAGSGGFEGSDGEVLHAHSLEGYAALEEGDSLLSVVVVSARRPIPDLERELPAEVGSGAGRRAALAAAAVRLEERLGCSVTVREILLERSP
jgi:hypothetical protein